MRGRRAAMRARKRILPTRYQIRRAAAHRLFDARVWGAPRLERFAQYVETDLGPRVGSLLSKTAHRVEPPTRRHRGRNAMLMMAAGVAAAGTVSAFVSQRGARPPLGRVGEPAEPETTVPRTSAETPPPPFA